MHTTKALRHFGSKKNTRFCDITRRNVGPT